MSPLVLAESAPVPFLVFPELVAAGLVHGVFTRDGGVSPPPYASLNVSLAVGDQAPRVRENRARIADALGFPPTQIFGASQAHGAASRVVEAALSPAALEREPLDILLTSVPDRLLLLKFADCLPLVLWDAERGAVSLAHAGWRGTAQKVAASAVKALARHAGSSAAGLWAGLGPAIGPCCYEVGPEVVQAVEAALPPRVVVMRPGERDRAWLDLVEANRQQLQAVGVRPDRIVAADQCTSCHPDQFFSHRALGAPAGRFAVAAGVR